jgi:hypothetical protein
MEVLTARDGEYFRQNGITYLRTSFCVNIH